MFEKNDSLTIDGNFEQNEEAHYKDSISAKRPVERASSSTDFLDDAKSQTREEITENIFESLISNKIIEDIEKSFREAGFSDSEINQIMLSASGAENKQILQAFSLPWELRKRRLGLLKEDIENGLVEIKNSFGILEKEAKDNGFTVGFHMSPVDILPEKSKYDPFVKTWSIKGYEMDDRDNRPMAYYSFDFNNLYKKRRARYLYIVRAQPIAGSGNKMNNKNNWGRASELSIIGKIDLNEFHLFDKIEEIYQHLKQKEIQNN